MKKGGGLRFNDGKNPLELVPPSLIFAVGEVLKAGAAKYAPRNWERGMSHTTVLGCLLRHVFKYASPFHSDFDEETGLHHLWHAACNVAMLIEYQQTCPELDDRIKYDMPVNPTVGPLTDRDLDELEREFTEHREERDSRKKEYFTGDGTDNV